MEECKRINAAKTHYEVLDLPNDAEEAEINKKFKRIALKVHPDKCRDPAAQDAFGEAFRGLKLAHATLSVQERRNYYDLLLMFQVDSFRPDLESAEYANEGGGGEETPAWAVVLLPALLVAALGVSLWQQFQTECAGDTSPPVHR